MSDTLGQLTYVRPSSGLPEEDAVRREFVLRPAGIFCSIVQQMEVMSPKVQRWKKMSELPGSIILIFVFIETSGRVCVCDRGFIYDCDHMLSEWRQRVCVFFSSLSRVSGVRLGIVSFRCVSCLDALKFVFLEFGGGLRKN